ncbi:hypothetical protein Tcan_02362 [Toxocara canis]|uniref:Uncharacterized protein n=1 Tax=Toxocara canis TaxID=6265 RepID=A0A0B2UQ34_TOXCA|nr:hypothetical protein Tcan_02362 [Toxocara canis]
MQRDGINKMSTSGNSLLSSVVDVDQRLLANPTLYNEKAQVTDADYSLSSSLHLDSCPVLKKTKNALVENGDEQHFILMRANKERTVTNYNESHFHHMQITSAVPATAPLISTPIVRSLSGYPFISIELHQPHKIRKFSAYKMISTRVPSSKMSCDLLWAPKSA